ncbi:MAG TPA: hypothetical protein VGJ28_26330, partial [Micromonosporaceae bacterium]
MGSYPCSNCGSTADTATGCPSCGRTLEAEIADLSRTITRMQTRSKGMVEERAALMSRLQGAIAIRSLLQRAAARHEGAIPTPRISRVLPVPGKARPMDMPVKRVRTKPVDTPVGLATTTLPRQVPAGRRLRQEPPPPTTPAPPPTTPSPPGHPHHPPETSVRESQNVVLAIGAIVMAIAVILTPFFYGSLGGGARVAILGILTAVTIAAPLFLSRSGLVTTSEWISPLGLLLVLLDGQELWHAQIRHTSLSAYTYAGLVMIVAAGVSAVYQRVSGLAVPRFATVVLVQPIPALLLYGFIHTLTAWAAMLTLVAAADLIVAREISRDGLHGKYLPLAVRALQELVNAGALVVGAIALLHVHHTWPSVAAGATVVAAAVVALAAGLLFVHKPLPDISAGVATLAAIGGFGRMGALAVPGWGLTATGLAILACAVGVRLLPAFARTGAQIGGGIAALVTVGDVVRRGWPALTAPIRATMPAWRADLHGYVGTVAREAGRHTGQLVPAALLITAAAVVLLPRAWRRSGFVVGIGIAAILAPGALDLPWWPGLLLGGIVALLIGVLTVGATTETDSWIGIGSAFVVGAYAAGISIAHPAGQAVLLGLLTIGGAFIAAYGSTAVGIVGIAPDRRTIEAAWGSAAFALPGAVAAATAIPAPHGAVVAEAVIAATFIAVAATLSAAAIAQVAWRRPVQLVTGGATLGALATSIATVRTPHLASVDIVIGVALLASGVLLVFAPSLPSGFRPTGGGRLRVDSLDGEEVAAAAVTVASIAALARVTALVAPGYFLVIVAALVLAIAAGTRSLPAEWRRGPVLGGGIVGALIAAACGYAAIDVAVSAVRMNLPIWHANLSDWAGRLTAHTVSLAHGPQVAIALLLIAAAARIVLPKRAAATAVAISLGLAVLILPETLHTSWWGPLAFSGVGATVAGLVAAASTDRVIGMARAGVATLLFANTIAASLITAGNTASTLIVSAGINASVAAMGIRTLRRVRAASTDPDDMHLVLIAGGALAGSILTFAGGTGTIAAALHAPLTVVLTAAMAGLGLALAAIAPLANRLEPVLLHVTGAIAIGGLVISLSEAVHFSTAGVFASFAALLSVLSEVMRYSVDHAIEVDGDGVPTRRIPRRVGMIVGWFPRRTEVLLAAGPATTLAIASVAPTIVAALIGPYRWVGMIWRGAPVTFHEQLGAFTGLVGAPAGALTALVLVATATAGAIGFGGSRDLMLARAVAVVTPGIAICLLIAPYLVRAAWPAGALAALAVATISGLALTLIEPPIDLNTNSSLRFARNLVVVICALSTGAGLAGSLAAEPMTIAALTIATITGAVAAGYGREPVSRIAGWIVTATAGQLLMLVICLVANLPAEDAAFAVGAMAGALLTVAALMPRLRRPENLTENITVEVSAYAGAVLGLILAARSIPHLAVFLAAWGAVLGIATARPQRPPLYRSALMWFGAAHELGAWILLMVFTRVAVPEAYTLGVAAVALVTGWI